MTTKKELIQKTYKGSFVLAINLVTFGLFFVRDIFSSRFFGLSKTLDSVYLAIMVPSLLANFLFQPLSDFLIPKYQSRIAQGGNILHLYLNAGFYVVITALFFSAVVYLLKSPISALLASGFSIEDRSIVADYIVKSIPIIFFGGLTISTNIFLNTIGLYLTSALAAIVVPVISIGMIYYLGAKGGEGVFITGMLLGQILNFLIVISVLFLKTRKEHNLSEFKVIRLRKSLVWEYGTQNLTNLCFYGFNAISASFGTHFHEGTASLVILVNKLIGFFTNLFNTTYTSVLMPYMSRVFIGSKDRFQQEGRFFLYLITIVSSLGVLCVVLGAGYLSQILFFSSKITIVQQADFVKYIGVGIFQVPFLISMVFFFKWLTIYSELRVLRFLSLFAILFDIGLNLILKDYFGVLSILLAPYLTLFLLMIVLVWVMGSKKIGIHLRDVILLTTLWIAMTLLLFIFVL